LADISVLTRILNIFIDLYKDKKKRTILVWGLTLLVTLVGSYIICRTGPPVDRIKSPNIIDISDFADLSKFSTHEAFSSSSTNDIIEPEHSNVLKPLPFYYIFENDNGIIEKIRTHICPGKRRINRALYLKVKYMESNSFCGIWLRLKKPPYIKYRQKGTAYLVIHFQVPSDDERFWRGTLYDDHNCIFSRKEFPKHFSETFDKYVDRNLNRYCLLIALDTFKNPPCNDHLTLDLSRIRDIVLFIVRNAPLKCEYEFWLDEMYFLIV